MPTVLHLLAQRPARTGSGTTLNALVQQGSEHGWDQWAAVGTPAEEPTPQVANLEPDRILALGFGQDGKLPFPLPGMSDVMPYASSRFRDLSPQELTAYRQAWQHHIAQAVERSQPDLIHSHHLWLMTSWLKEVAPEIPVLAHCHATGLRQRALCPHLAPEVDQGIGLLEHFATLHHDHARALEDAFRIEQERITIVGAGYREELFFADTHHNKKPHQLIYVGKQSAAKGLFQLLEAFEEITVANPNTPLELHVVGGGSGAEARELQKIMGTIPQVIVHGLVPPAVLVRLMRQSAVCVLPSFYEGVPLVLVEALACGCRVVVTDLPGVRDQLAPHFGSAMERIPLPRLATVDQPRSEELPAFVQALKNGINTSLARGPLDVADPALVQALKRFSWSKVFGRVERIWRDLLGDALGPLPRRPHTQRAAPEGRSQRTK